jgi:hypothetical protein
MKTAGLGLTDPQQALNNEEVPTPWTARAP